MFMVVTYLTLLSRLPYWITAFRTCVPNTQFVLNGHLCTCNSLGRYVEAICNIVGRRRSCQPGQVVWQGCNQCICQENGQLLCTNVGCVEDTTFALLRQGQTSKIGPWCTPFTSYYVDCNVCACPASGKTSDARCVTDTSCSLKGSPTTADLVKLTNNNVCLPKVMYLFPCLQCLCSDEGLFVIDKCVETCQRPQQVKSSQRCIPRTLYRKDCNICLCPDDSLHDNKYCTKAVCNENLKSDHLRNLKSKPSSECIPYTFTKSRCFYCDCSPEGTVNENACVELDCLKSSYQYNTEKDTCIPGDIVLICVECFCLRYGSIDEAHCTRTCSYQSKLGILENVLKKTRSVANTAIKRTTMNNVCDPNTIYIEQGKYCLCPENGSTDFKLCTTPKDEYEDKSYTVSKGIHVSIDYNVSCEANTFVEFDCNTCFCNKKGKIDPKWCTYDDCDSKRTIQKSHKLPSKSAQGINDNGTCIPGSISKIECNFCICPDSGLLENRVCTKNQCSTFDPPSKFDKFSCEPLSYYEVDCNICYCPRDGLKNVAKCTKNICEKSFLRSEICVAGQLFSDECNVCVCPPNGDKSDKVCTNNTCPESAFVWKMYNLSQNLLLQNQITEDSKRSLDLCFPGEEFVVGCKLCVCPDMGLRIYATCAPTTCDDDQENERSEDLHTISRRQKEPEGCFYINITGSAERQECTPGSMYIIRCRQCICPYMGNINQFCRPLPYGTHCEQPFPGFNYIPMSRRNKAGNSTRLTTKGSATNTSINLKQIHIEHLHTKYKCSKPGRVMDKCFICDCEEGKNVIIEEHCFKSDATFCVDTKPSFLSDENKIIFG